jgi:hypothetical protein
MTTMETPTSYRQRPIQWLKPGEVVHPPSPPAAQPTTAAFQLLKVIRVIRVITALFQFSSHRIPQFNINYGGDRRFTAEN